MQSRIESRSGKHRTLSLRTAAKRLGLTTRSRKSSIDRSTKGCCGRVGAAEEGGGDLRSELPRPWIMPDRLPSTANRGPTSEASGRDCRSERARTITALSYDFSGGVIIVLIAALMLLTFNNRRNLTIRHALPVRETDAFVLSTSAKGLPEPILLAAASEDPRPIRSAARVIQPAKSIFWIFVAAAGIILCSRP